MMKTGNMVIRKLFAGLALGVLAAAAGTVTALAADIDSIRLEFTDQYEEGTILEPEIESRTSGVEIESVTWSRDPEKWQPGSKVTGTITLSGDGEFASSYGSRTLKITGATASGTKVVDGYLKVTVKYYPVAWLGTTETAGWKDAEHTVASWKKVNGATGYHLRLYRDNVLIQTMTVSGTTKDLKEYMNKSGEYYYDICATGKNAEDRKYRRDGSYVTSTDSIVAQEDLGETDGRWLNYTEGRKYMNEDGTSPANQWVKIDRAWYYFDENGYAATGWRQVGGIWYYMDANSVMLTGWQQINGVWYFLNPDGSMAIGWRETSPGEWYYLNPDGSMAANTVIDGWQLDASGKRIG